MYLSKQGIQKSLGPGILLAGAAIGGSHLLSSTTAVIPQDYLECSHGQKLLSYLIIRKD